MRRWQCPASVVEAANRTENANALTRDLAQGLPVGAITLQAIVSSGSYGVITQWATNVLNKVTEAEESHLADVLVSSGFDETGCNPPAFGILDPDYDGERIVAVVRADREPETWQRITASGWESCDAPEGMPYLDLRGDTLADALETVAAGASLLLHPAEPQAWLSSKVELPVLSAATALAPAPAPPTSASGDPAAVVYAIVDPLNTSAVLSLFEVSPGPKIAVRKAGAWQPDDGTLQSQLTGFSPPPVVAVSPAQIPDVLRQVDDFDSTHPATAAGPNGGQAPQAQAPTPPGQPAPVAASADMAVPSVAGLCVRAADTGRVFMLQRGIDPKDPASGKIEIPGGHLEDDETTLEGAQREWQEETGQQIPDGTPGGQWTSANGVYRGHVHEIPNESAINLADRKAGTNPDDPHGDSFEAAMWMDPTHLANNPAVRDEVQKSMPLVHAALDQGALPADTELDSQEALAASASMHHARRIREAKSADSQWDADRAATDLAEQSKRRDFETMIASRYNVLKGEGHDESTSASTVRREIEAENSRRDLWEQQRSDALLAEKERRLRVQPDVRLSQELVERIKQAKPSNLPLQLAPGPQPAAVTADAVPHTLLPPQLFKYWVAGKGALKIHWGIKGDWQRCRDHLTKYVKSDYQTKALCAELHKFATGRWTGSKANKEIEGHGL